MNKMESGGNYWLKTLITKYQWTWWQKKNYLIQSEKCLENNIVAYKTQVRIELTNILTQNKFFSKCKQKKNVVDSKAKKNVISQR